MGARPTWSAAACALLLLVSVAGVTVAAQSDVLVRRLKVLNGRTLTWIINRTAEVISFELVAPVKSWTAVGLGSVGKMNSPATGVMGGPWGVIQLSLDMVNFPGLRPAVGPSMLRATGSSPSWPPPTTFPRSATEPAETFTPLDAETGIVDTPSWEVLPDGGQIRLRFARTFAAGGDSTDLALNPDRSTWILVSHGDEGVYRPGYHGPSNRRAYKLVLSDCTGGPGLGDDGDDKHFTRMIHGMTMFFGWGLASAAGVYVARYCRHKRWWIEFHVKLMSAASVGAISALILAVGIVQTQLAHWHAVLGATVMSLTLVQVGMGWYIHSRRMLRLGAEGGSSAVEAWVAVAHRMTGRCLFAGAMVNMFEGLRLIGATSVFAASLGAFLSLVGGAFVVAEIQLQLSRRRPDAQRKQQKDLILGTALATVQAAVRARIPTSTALRHAASSADLRSRRVSPASEPRLLQEPASHHVADASADDVDPLTAPSTTLLSGALVVASPIADGGALGPGAAMRSAAQTVLRRRRKAAALICEERERHAVVDTAQFVEDSASLDAALAEQLHAQVVFSTILDMRHCAVLASAPSGRSAEQVGEVAVALAALPMFAGSRVAVAALHASGVRSQATVSRIAQANEALRMAGRLDQGDERLVETWWSAHPRLLDLCATVVLLADGPPPAGAPLAREGGVVDVAFGPDPGGRHADPADDDHGTTTADGSLPPAAWGRLLRCVAHRLDPLTLEPSKRGTRVVAPFVVVRGSVTLGLLRASSGMVMGDNPAATASLTGIAATAAAGGGATVAPAVPPSPAGAAAPHADDVVARVTVEAGQRWSPQLSHPHTVQACSTDCLVLVFEPAAWARFHDPDAAAVPLQARLGGAAAGPPRGACAVM